MKKKIVVYTIRDFEKICKKNGYYFRKQTGSHRIYTNGKEQISIPVHGKEMDRYMGKDLIAKYHLSV